MAYSEIVSYKTRNSCNHILSFICTNLLSFTKLLSFICIFLFSIICTNSTRFFQPIVILVDLRDELLHLWRAQLNIGKDVGARYERIDHFNGPYFGIQIDESLFTCSRFPIVVREGDVNFSVVRHWFLKERDRKKILREKITSRVGLDKKVLILKDREFRKTRESGAV